MCFNVEMTKLVVCCRCINKLMVRNAPCSALTALTVDGAAVDSSLYEFVPSGNGANEAPLLAHLMA